VPENRRLFPRLSVRDNLRLGSYLYRGEAEREAPLDLVFKLFPRLQERLEQRAETLSGGEQQMLAIGRALMTRPRLLMLDEPSQGIMPNWSMKSFRPVKRIRDAGMTVLIVEQRMSECLEIATAPTSCRRARADAGQRGGYPRQSGCAEGVSGDVMLTVEARSLHVIASEAKQSRNFTAETARMASWLMLRENDELKLDRRRDPSN
jgi:ABC-type sugar transport system ATPase subunit